MVSVYEQQFAAISEYIKALNAAKKATELIESHSLLYMKEIQLTDGDGTDWGTLRDEIGGEWCWYPPEASDEG